MFKPASCLGVVASALALVVGCASPVEEASGEAAGAANAAEDVGLRLKTANYGELKVVVRYGEIRGTYYSALGIQNQGGSSCSFTFAGRIDEADDGRDASVVTVTDGTESFQGKVRVMKRSNYGDGAGPDINLEFDHRPCPWSSGNEISFTDAEPLAGAGLAGWAPVSAEKAYFYDAPKGQKRAAFVMRSDIVALMDRGDGDIVKDGFVQAEYVNARGQKTTGWLWFGDLMAPWTASE